MTRYQTRPSYIEAVRWKGTNIAEALGFDSRLVYNCNYGNPRLEYRDPVMGDRTVPVGDFIIRYGNGDLGTCERDTFRSLYRAVFGNAADAIAAIRAYS